MFSTPSVYWTPSRELHFTMLAGILLTKVHLFEHVIHAWADLQGRPLQKKLQAQISQLCWNWCQQREIRFIWYHLAQWTQGCPFATIYQTLVELDEFFVQHNNKTHSIWVHCWLENNWYAAKLNSGGIWAKPTSNRRYLDKNMALINWI